MGTAQKRKKRRDPNKGSSEGGGLGFLRWFIPISLTLIGLLVGYKYAGAEDLRNSVYRPLFSEVAQVENALKQNTLTVDFPTATKTKLDTAGEMNRLPRALREKVQKS